MKKLNNISVFGLIIGLAVGLGFLFLNYKFLPLGIALVITGGIFSMGAREANDKISYYISTIGSWFYPVGIIVTFWKNGWQLGLLSIIIGFISYKFAKK